MMKYLTRTLLSSLLLTTMSAELQANPVDPFAQSTSKNTETLAKYLLNLGGFLGFDLTQSATPQGVNPTQNLLNANMTQAAQVSLYETLLGAIPVNAINPPLMQFVPNNGGSNSGYAGLNPLANVTFSNPPYDNPSQQQGNLSVNPTIDQLNYQKDPINQAVLNILSTPNSTYCMDNDGTKLLESCNSRYDSLVTQDVIGVLPGPKEFFTYKYNQKFLSQLNGNTLLSPLLYTTSSDSGSNTSSSPQPSSQSGLPGDSQLQQAANYIRYATGMIIPASLPKYREYDSLYTKAMNLNKNTPAIEQMRAKTILSNYFGKLRIYAAQMSVGLSNMYYILSRRMPQKLTGDKVSSQALSEFTMATWRLYNPDNTSNVQWLEQINKASSATVQKEMVTLLAEINYQLYLNRQQDERLLLTETMMLLQNIRMSQPSGSPLDNEPSTTE